MKKIIFLSLASAAVLFAINIKLDTNTETNYLSCIDSSDCLGDQVCVGDGIGAGQCQDVMR